MCPDNQGHESTVLSKNEIQFLALHCQFYSVVKSTQYSMLHDTIDIMTHCSFHDIIRPICL